MNTMNTKIKKSLLSQIYHKIILLTEKYGTFYVIIYFNFNESIYFVFIFVLVITSLFYKLLTLFFVGFLSIVNIFVPLIVNKEFSKF